MLDQKYPWAKFVLTHETMVPHRVPFPLARRFQQICIAYLAKVYADEDLIDLEYAGLACVDDFPGIDQSRFAALVGIDRTSASQMLERLDAAGLLMRQISGHDRRVRLLHLTARGKTLRRRLRPKVLAAQDRMLTPLNVKERVLLMDLLVRVIEANESHARPGAGRRPPRKKIKASSQGVIDDKPRARALRHGRPADRGRSGAQSGTRE